MMEITITWFRTNKETARMVLESQKCVVWDAVLGDKQLDMILNFDIRHRASILCNASRKFITQNFDLAKYSIHIKQTFIIVAICATLNIKNNKKSVGD